MLDLTYSPEIKQLAAAMMRLYPKSWLDIDVSCVTINFSAGAAYKFSYDEDGFLDTVNVSPNMSFKQGVRRTSFSDDIQWLIGRGWKVPVESDLCMSIFEEIKNSDIDEDIAYFDENYERNQLSRRAHQRKESVNMILGILLFITFIVFESGAIEKSDSVFLHNIVDTLRNLTSLRATFSACAFILLIIVIYNSIFTFRYSMKRKKGFVR